MDEPSPWGASDDLPTFPRRSPSPKLRYSPPPAASISFATPAWQDEGGGGWGGAVDDYVPGAFGSGVTPSDDAGFKPDDRDVEVVPPPSLHSVAASGWNPEAPELAQPRAGDSSSLAGDAASSLPRGFHSSPPPSPPALPLPSFPSDSLDDATAHHESAEPEDGDDGGWGGAEPDLPPIGALRVAAPESPAADDSRDDGWGPAQEGLDAEEEEPPLPSLGDLFPSAAISRRQSVELAQKGEQGEDAWGSSQGWEERMRLEAEAREKQRIAEAKAAGVEPEEERKQDDAAGSDPNAADNKPADGDKPAAKSGLASIFRFRKTAEDTATRAVESAKETTATAARGAAALARSASSRPSSEQESGARASGDAERPAGKSWLSRVAAGKENPGKVTAEDDDPNSLGVEEVQQGESGRATSPEPQQGSVFGRLFGRKKASATESAQRSTPTSARNSGEQQAASDLRVQDLDALGDPGLVARLQAQAQLKKSKYDYDDDEEDSQPPPPSSFFGSRSVSTSRVPDAPSEDDFGGLLGAFSVAPASASATVKASSKAFDPFDPLSDSFGAAPPPQPSVSSRPVAAPAFPRPPPPPVASSSRPDLSAPAASRPHPASQVASFGSPPRAAPAALTARASSPMDDFDAFFDSVAASTGNQPAVKPASIVAPVPRALQPGPPAASAPVSRNAASGGTRPRVVSPPPRLTVSPPVRMATASPLSASSGRSTPIMPLAPPPPPSQPLAATRLVGLDAPPAGPASASVLASAAQQRVPSPAAITAPLAPKPALSPALAASTKGRTPSPQPPPPQVQRAPSSSGPLSLDDLSFFES
ncbi:hypothetical protein DMC30DRAFT_399468 [Rhodotorula diobovata]|uniref:Proteophosphoglycan ppg4 n=1 Tax=Rhodotorula diobovata TaxID=5288 RepID=A0A5C5FSL3_9BASI|nr:hypothetical protein DMC30DRAFT_399468 [Rhodotorula diobovata]